MTNLVKPEIILPVKRNYNGVEATFKLGKVEWNVNLQYNQTISKVDKYCKGFKDLENLRETFYVINTEIDEHCHDEFLVNELTKFLEQERIEAQKKEQERKDKEDQELEELRQEIKEAFPGYTCKFTLRSIDVSDGISTIHLNKSWNDSGRWECDQTETKWSGGHSYKIGEKKTSKKLSKLTEFVEKHLNSKTAAVKYKNEVIKSTQENDNEMLSLGYELAVQGEYIGQNPETKKSEYKMHSNSGTTYKKGNITIYVKRIEGILKVVKYTVEGLNNNILDFKW